MLRKVHLAEVKNVSEVMDQMLSNCKHLVVIYTVCLMRLVVLYFLFVVLWFACNKTEILKQVLLHANHKTTKRKYKHCVIDWLKIFSCWPTNIILLYQPFTEYASDETRKSSRNIVTLGIEKAARHFKPLSYLLCMFTSGKQWQEPLTCPDNVPSRITLGFREPAGCFALIWV